MTDGPRYVLGPSIGVARLGDSPDSFYLEPEAIGGLPIECDDFGNARMNRTNLPVFVRSFKSNDHVRRQGARFRIYRIDDANPAGVEVTLGDPEVASIVWTVHLANKKAAWYNFGELAGNLLYGADNSYTHTGIVLRNQSVTDPTLRQKLIIDPGPRTVSGARQSASLDSGSVPPDYPFWSFPTLPTYGTQITTLGDLRTDDEGRLVVLGGFGVSGGNTTIASFAGADTWHDDVADGPVTCVMRMADGTVVTLQGWCVVGSPKFAPELVNIVTLADTMHDVAVRHMDVEPSLCSGGIFQGTYIASFERDIVPILNRPGTYRWVANTPQMNSMSPAPFDARDASNATGALRSAYFQRFRQPSPENKVGASANDLFLPGMHLPGGFPMMPLNSGSNSVGNSMPDKFFTLTETQYFLLGQWAAGEFTIEPAPLVDTPTLLSQASVGNCVGGPFCPGIEVTWTTRNPNIYSGPLAIRSRHDESYYATNGLSIGDDETADALGCEPGDMTKRMAIPWQADFFQCSVQFVNFTDSGTNKEGGIPKPPTYYAYWWPPQSPWVVMTGDLDAISQQAAGTPAGMQVLYTRGINTFGQMIAAWSHMGFVVNQATDEFGSVFPNFTEQERNHSSFVAAAVAVGDAGNVVSGSDSNFSNAWLLPMPPVPSAVAASFGTSRRQGRVALRD